VYLQINTVKYNAYQEITNTYDSLQIVRSQSFTDMLLFVYIRSTSNFIGLSVYRFVANEYQRIAIWLLSTIHTIGQLFDDEGNFKLFAPTYSELMTKVTKIIYFIGLARVQ
jgi:hypothetical protein